MPSFLPQAFGGEAETKFFDFDFENPGSPKMAKLMDDNKEGENCKEDDASDDGHCFGFEKVGQRDFSRFLIFKKAAGRRAPFCLGNGGVFLFFLGEESFEVVESCHGDAGFWA